MTRSIARTLDAPGVVKGPHRWTILDVRTPAEFETQHIDGSYNVPLEVLTRNAAEVAERLSGEPVLLVCHTGARATAAQRALAAVGAAETQVLTGGVPAFAAAGGAMVDGKPTWALERQVRLVAGGIVLASILTSLRWPKARFIAGGIGGGLCFSALTNSCAMGNVLMRLPYNRGPQGRTPEFYLRQLTH